ncbi:MAG: serine hydrolase domain-containing protein, partial [Acidimicrobiia bacterium]
GAQVYVSRAGEVAADLGIGAMEPGSSRPWLSATKAVTAVAAARLWEQGMFALDDRVADFVPGFERGGKDGVTIRHLLTHTGGFRFSEELEPGWVPGDKAGYHPRTGFAALAEVLHQVDGRSFVEIATQDVLAPLGIAAVFTDPDNAVSAGLSGPMRELAKLYEALLDGGRGVISRETIAEFTRRHRSAMFDHTFGAIVDMGLGFILDSKEHGRIDVPYGYGPHASPGAFGHGGSQSCTGFADPQHNLCVAVMFDSMPGEKPHQQRMFATLAAVYEDLGLAGASEA